MQSAEMHADRIHLIAAATCESNIQCRPNPRRNRNRGQTCSSIESGEDVMGKMAQTPISLRGNLNRCIEISFVAFLKRLRLLKFFPCFI